ncbi:ABC transporter permease subunit, partial [Methylophilaceae bacterium]|nr:ABC transporter permease subunit [Methylophilaceae bacterium]
FSWDGLGKLLVTSIQTRDYPVTQACILIIATSFVFINFLTEVAYRFLDPRMRH